MTLSNDTARCVGFGLRDPMDTCTERDTCERYLQIERDRVERQPCYPISMMAMPRRGMVCEYRIEVAA